MVMRSLGDEATGKNNNLDLIRLIAAIAVLYSHSVPLVTGDSGLEPFRALSHGQFTLGRLAVAVFFVASGFLITQSYSRLNHFVRFVWARFLRIMPGLVGVVLFTTFVLGPIMSTLTVNAYFKHHGTYQYLKALFMGILFRGAPASLPGVFQSNPFGPAVNGSLWTLIPQILCYGLVAFMGLTKLLRKSLTLVAFAASTMLPFVWHHSYSPLFAYFAAGMVLCAYRQRVPLTVSLAVLSALVVVITSISGGFGTLAPLFIGYLVMYAAYGTTRKWPSFTKYGDFSYGVYIYGFPVQQALIDLSDNSLSPLANFLVSTPVVLAFAYLSWRFIESKALRYKNINTAGQRLTAA